MKRHIKRIMCYLMVVFMVLSVCSISPKAAPPGGTGGPANIGELRAAIMAADDGDVIKLAFPEAGVFFKLDSNETLIIDKSITIDLNGNPVTLSQGATIKISNNSTVDIINSFGSTSRIVFSITQGNPVSRNTLFTVGNGCTLNIRGGIHCEGTLAIEPSQGAGTAGKINVFSGSYKYRETSDKLFDINYGTLVIYSGEFEDNPEYYEDYIVEGAELSEDSASGIFEVIRPMSEGFKRILKDDGKLYVDAVRPTNEDALEATDEAWALVNASLGQYFIPEVDPYSYYADCVDFDRNIYRVSYMNYEDTDYYMSEDREIEVVFTGELDANVGNRVNTYADKIKEKYIYGAPAVYINDLEVINMLSTGFDSDNLVCMANMANFSVELKALLDNTNIKLTVHNSMAGATGEFCNMSAGITTLDCNGVMSYGFSYFEAVARNIIYVPDRTYSDTDALIAAAKKRIDDYLGDSSRVSITYAGLFSNYADEDIRDMILRDMNIDPADAPQYYFDLKIDGDTYRFFIIPDDSKMVDPKCVTLDINSNIIISTGSNQVPLDTSISAKKIESGSDYDSLISKLNVEDNVTYDLKLYSDANEKVISKVTDDTFEVSIPIPDSLKGQDLMAYYVDADGKVTKYPANPVGDNAVFETNHFSIYTIAKAQPDVCTVNGASHKLTAVPAKAATTTAEGNKAYWTCDCGKWFADANGKTEITDKTSIIIPKLKDTTTESNTTTEAGNKETPSGTPDTGDSTNVVLLFGLLLVSAAVIFPKKKEK